MSGTVLRGLAALGFAASVVLFAALGAFIWNSHVCAQRLSRAAALASHGDTRAAIRVLLAQIHPVPYPRQMRWVGIVQSCVRRARVRAETACGLAESGEPEILPVLLEIAVLLRRLEDLAARAKDDASPAPDETDWTATWRRLSLLRSMVG